MNVKQKGRVKKCLSVVVGILIAFLFSAPYIIFRKQIQQVAVIGYISLILTCVVSNISILFPSSSTLIVVTAASTLNPILCILCGGIGTCIGEQSSYICGRVGVKELQRISEQNKTVLEWLNKWEFITVFIFAFIPLPVFDLVGIAAGIVHMKWVKYTIAAVLGKLLKFLCAIIGVYYAVPYIIEVFPGTGSDMLRQMLNQLGLV